MRPIFLPLILIFCTGLFFGNISYAFAQNETLIPSMLGNGTPFTLTSTTLEAPLKQFKAGSSLYDINCRNDLLLVAKLHRDSPACVKPFSMLHLLETGWGYIPRAFETNTDLLNTTITSGEIVGFKFDVQAASIVIGIQTTENGTCTVTIPKVLTNAMSWYGLNPSHGVLVNEYMVEFEEINSTKGAMITFPLTYGPKLVEIVGTR